MDEMTSSVDVAFKSSNNFYITRHNASLRYVIKTAFNTRRCHHFCRLVTTFAHKRQQFEWRRFRRQLVTVFGNKCRWGKRQFVAVLGNNCHCFWQHCRRKQWQLSSSTVFGNKCRWERWQRVAGNGDIVDSVDEPLETPQHVCQILLNITQILPLLLLLLLLLLSKADLY